MRYIFILYSALQWMLPCSMKTSNVQWNIKTQSSVLKMRNNQGELWSFTVSMILYNTVIPRLTKIIRSGITFVSRNLRSPKLLAVSNVNNPVGLVCLPYVMWSAHFFVTHIQTEKISSCNGPTVHVCCFMLARASTKTFVSRIHMR